MRLRKFILFLCAGVAAAAVVVTTQQSQQENGKSNVAQFDPSLVMTPQVKELITKSCADCHSMTPHLPWYAHVPPASWLVNRDIQKARAAMNLTQWSRTNGKSVRSSIGTLAAMCADVRSGRMPHKNYLWMHPEAKMNEAEADAFCSWTAQQMMQTGLHKPAAGR